MKQFPRVRTTARYSMLAFALISRGALHAQGTGSTVITGDWTSRVEKPSGFTAAFPPSVMHVVDVALYAAVQKNADSAIALQALLMAQEVADEFRRNLGAAGVTIPAMDERYSWDAVPTAIDVVAHRDGSAIVSTNTIGGESAATRSLVAAFDSARAHNFAVMLWSDRTVSDSVVVHLWLQPSYFTRATTEEETDHTPSFPVFSLSEPELSPALPEPNQPPPRYPPSLESRGVSGSVLMQFTVDTSGRMESATLREIVPADALRTYEVHENHEQFAQSVARWLETVRFVPASLGGCRIRQRVQFPLKFTVRP